MSIVP